MSNFSHGNGNILKIKGGDSDNIVDVTDEKRLKIEVAFAPDAVPSYAYISLTIGDGSSQITPNTMGYSAPVPFSGKIIGWSIASIVPNPVPGSIEVEFFRDSILNFPPTTNISGTKPVVLNNQAVNYDNNIENDWVTSVSVNDCFGFNVVSTDNILTKVMIIVHMERNI